MSAIVHMLVIDDNPDDRLLAIRALQREFPNLQVTEIIDAASFAAALEGDAFDVVVTDYQLGWTTGLDIVHAIKARDPNRPVIMFTATGNQEVAVEAMKAGLDDYVIKSLRHWVRLPVAVRSALERAATVQRMAAAEEARRESEAKLRLLLDQLPVYVWTTDTALRITQITGTGITRAGRDPDEFIGQILTEIRGVTDLNAPTIAAHLHALAGQSTTSETRFGQLDLEVRVEPLRNASGQIIGCLSVAIDITERRWGERRLAAQYRVGQALAAAVSLDDAAPQVLAALGEELEWDYGGLWVVDRNQHVLRCISIWQRRAAELDEFAAISQQTTFAQGEGLPGSIWASGEPRWVADIATERHFPRLQIATSAGMRSGFALPIRLDGRVNAVMEFLSHEVRPSNPEFLTMATTLSGQLGQFIEHRWAEEDLRVRARQQAAIAEIGQRALTILDLDVLMHEATVLAAQILHVEYCNVLQLLPDGQEFLIVAGTALDPAAIGHLTVSGGLGSPAGYALLTGERLVVDDLRTETRFERPQLLVEWGIISSVIVIIEGQDRPFGVVTAHTTRRRAFSDDDVHFLQAVANVIATVIRRKDVEERLAQERAEAARLEELEHLRSEFIASVSHDLRTPLTAAESGLGMLEVSLAERLRADERSLLDNARRNIGRLAMLISDLLTYNQIEAGVLQLERQALDLRMVVADVLATVHPLIAQKGQTLAVDLPEPLPTVGDRWRLGQVMINLLANAHEHTPPGTAITVKGRQTADTVVVTVSDTGPGIPKEVLDIIFQRFKRLGLATGGSGLGLTIVKRIVELHGGRVWAASAPRQGAHFHVELPSARLAADEGLVGESSPSMTT